MLRKYLNEELKIQDKMKKLPFFVQKWMGKNAPNVFV